MCGIACYVGIPQKMNVLVSALEKLEYRGYDSAGVASLNNGEIVCKKSVGNIANLRRAVDLNQDITCAISHTRWATHGKVCEINAHPHLSEDKLWAVVHNGIIENYNELKQKYNVNPQSSTDTAVVAECLEKLKCNDILKFIQIISEVKGSFAISAICKNKKDQIFLAKRNSPLFVAENNGSFFVASDLACFEKFSTKYYDFDDNEFAVIENNQIKFYDSLGGEICKSLKAITIDFESSGKGDYQHFMQKEIFEEKNALIAQVNFYKANNVLDIYNAKFFEGIERIKFIGCGTAYHAGLIGAIYAEKILGIPAMAEIASEFVYKSPNLISAKELYIFVSQSGETADILKSLEIIKKHNVKFVTLTNVLHSSLAKKSTYILPVCAGKEIAVASTKAYVCQLSALYMFFKNAKIKINNEKISENNNYYDDILRLSETILNFSHSKIENIAHRIKDKAEVIFIGKGLGYVTACEASLKLKEISYINSSSFAAGELKHGYLALIEEGVPLFVFECEKDLQAKTANAAEEAVSRGAEKFVITNSGKTSENNIVICSENELLLSIAAIVPMQYLAYRVSVMKNINPDQPRNLAKSVTVE